MKLVHRLIGLVLFLVVVLAGVAMMYAAMPRVGVWDQVVARLPELRTSVLLAGMLLVLLAVLYLLTIFRRGCPEQFLTFDNEGGTVSISVTAIRDFLCRLGAGFAELVELRPSITTADGAIAVELDVKVKSGTQIPETCKAIQDRVRAQITGSLGISDISSIKINVREIVESAATPAPAGGAKPGNPSDWEGDSVKL